MWPPSFIRLSVQGISSYLPPLGFYVMGCRIYFCYLLIFEHVYNVFNFEHYVNMDGLDHEQVRKHG